MTANYSWRLVFAGETVVVLALMLFLRLIPATLGRPSKLDLRGAFLSAAGLGLAVFGVLRSSQWGWIAPSPSAPVAPLGLSPVFWLIVAGLVLLGLFARHERAMIAAGKEPLLDMRLLEIPPMRAGLTTYLSQQFIVMATFFVLPLYLQTVLGYDALETGITILPLSIALFVFALAGARLAGRYSPKRIAAAGLLGNAQRRDPADCLHRAGPALGRIRASRWRWSAPAMGCWSHSWAMSSCRPCRPSAAARPAGCRELR